MVNCFLDHRGHGEGRYLKLNEGSVESGKRADSVNALTISRFT